MKNNIKAKSIIASILFMCSYTQSILSFEGLPERERKMSPAQIEQLEHRVTPLHLAETVQQVTGFLEYGADMNAQDMYGFTPLQYMLDGNHLLAATYLIEQGAQINKDDRMKHLNLLKKECVFKERK